MTDTPVDVAAKLERIAILEDKRTADDLRAAASMLRDMSEREKALREALEPFAISSARDWDDDAPDDTEIWQSQGSGWPTERSSFDVGDLRRAAKALEPK